MRLGREGYPVVILSHRKQEFLERTVSSLRVNSHGVTDVIVVDDSGDRDHHQWLDDHGYQYTLSSPDGSNVGYLGAMQTVWETARFAADQAGVDYALLWEEDFRLTRSLSIHDMATIMDQHPTLAQLNLQRQAVYRIERRSGYMESHQRRGYGLVRHQTAGLPWVSRKRPFTTNPSLIRREVLNMSWPSREVANLVPGGAEPAMSLYLEEQGYGFGWFGSWNSRYTLHVGAAHKTGTGY